MMSEVSYNSLACICISSCIVDHFILVYKSSDDNDIDNVGIDESNFFGRHQGMKVDQKD